MWHNRNIREFFYFGHTAAQFYVIYEPLVITGVAMNWIEITETEYMDVLAVLPPALQLGHGFLFDEPTIHKEGRPCYSPYLCIDGRYFAGSEPMTNAEFRALRIDELVLPEIHRERIANRDGLLASRQGTHPFGIEGFTREAA